MGWIVNSLNRIFQSNFLLFILIFSNFSFVRSNENSNDNWKDNNTSFIYQLYVKQIFSFNSIVGFVVKITLTYIDLVNDTAYFQFTTFTTLSNYAGTEKSNGTENINTREITIDYSTANHFRSLISYFGFSNKVLYNPFSIPVSNYTRGDQLPIWTMQHYYINSSSVIWLGNYFTTNNFEYESSTIKNIALYESTKGILLFSQFTLETPKFNITAELKLQETSLFSTMPVPLINYIVAMLLLIALPSLAVGLYFIKKLKNKKRETGGLK